MIIYVSYSLILPSIKLGEICKACPLLGAWLSILPPIPRPLPHKEGRGARNSGILAKSPSLFMGEGLGWGYSDMIS